MNHNKKLEEYLPKGKPKAKHPIYTMVRFDNRLDLLKHVVQRVAKLKTSKNAYVLALIAKDMEENPNDKS